MSEFPVDVRVDAAWTRRRKAVERGTQAGIMARTGRPAGLPEAEGVPEGQVRGIPGGLLILVL